MGGKSLRGENRERGGSFSGSLSLPKGGELPGRAASLLPSQPTRGSHRLHGSAGSMRLTAEESRRTVTTDNGAEAL